MQTRTQWGVAALGMALLLLVPWLSDVLEQPYYLDLFTRVVVFAIAALSLDLILGYAGILSFGHAVYLGIGGYAVGILGFYGVSDGFLQFAIAIAASAGVALLIGAMSLRTSGVYLIMITLAFGQMFYFLAISIQTFGGDDGLTIARHSDFGRLVDLGDPAALYYACCLSLLAVLVLSQCVVTSRFGMVIRGVKSNEPRMVALGVPVFRYKLAAFVISGAMCGFAGALLANQGMFVSPAIMHWSRSGELMIMVILGGIGSLFGPVVGAVVYLVLEDTLSSLSDHWQLGLGIIVLLIVLFAKRGIFGLANHRFGRLRHG
jgi:branched-chain amino acid transport system permease protein